MDNSPAFRWVMRMFLIVRCETGDDMILSIVQIVIFELPCLSP